MIISNTFIINSVSQNGYGGGISYITDKNLYDLKIENSFIENNSAKFGGGLYLEF